MLGVSRIDFFFRFGFRSLFGKTRIWFGMSLLRFNSVQKMQFGFDIIVNYYSCNSCKYFDVTHNNDK